MKPTEKNLSSELAELLRELTSLMGVQADIEVEVEKDDEGFLATIDLETEEHTGLLIGNKGETLNAIQTFLAIAIKNKFDTWVKIRLNVGDWREKQEEYLSDLAAQTAERAKETGEPQYLYNLNSAQRRVVHVKLAEEDGIETFSEGEGRERYLVVKTK